MEKITVIRQINSEYRRNNNKYADGTVKYPYGLVQMSVSKSLPNGIFMITDGETVYPSLHGMTADALLAPRKLCISADCTEYNPTFHYVETDNEIYLVNTGADVLRAGDNFIVTLPDFVDSEKQRSFSKSSFGSTWGPQFDNIGHEIWGGALAVRALGGSSVLGELLKRVQELPVGLGLHEIISPYTTKAIFGTARMIAASTAVHGFPNNTVQHSLQMVTGTQPIAPATIGAILNDASVTYYINEILRGLSEMLPTLTGLGGGVVMRPSSGHSNEEIHPGDGFMAKINRLSQL